VPEESYIVRIYRRGPFRDGLLVGVVETPGSGWQKPFHSMAELAGILTGPKPRPGAAGRTATRHRPAAAAKGTRA
jgi:hypothetical protein